MRTGRKRRTGMGSVPLLPSLTLLLFSIHASDAFIKAAIGLRIGYSPTEKGYGQPLQINNLHSKNPAMKGQFLTGVHNAEGRDLKQTPVVGGSGLLKHLKILGVNLYLGGPKHGHHVGGGDHQGGGGHGQNLVQPPRPPAVVGTLGPHGGPLGPRDLDHLNRGRGPRGQYSAQVPLIHGPQGGELRGIEVQNEIGGGSGYSFPAGSSEVFQQAASQYPSYHNLNVISIHPNWEQNKRFPPAMQMPASVQHQSQQNGVILMNNGGHGQPALHHHPVGPVPTSGPPAPRPSGPPPRQGFSLASLMRGPQWTVRPRLFRMPLMLQFGRSHSPPPPHNNPQQQQVLHHMPAQQSSPRMQYSTLFSVNPTNTPPSFPAMSPSASTHPQSAHPFIMPPPMMNQQIRQQFQQPQPGAGSQSYASSDYFPTINSPQQPQFHQPHPQAQTMQSHAGQPQFHHMQDNFQQYRNNNPSHYAPPRHNNNNNNEYDDPRQHGMPEDMRPPPGFEYSHSDTSPIVSMGMASYDDPPIMMDNLGGNKAQREENAPPRQNHNNHHQNNYQGGGSGNTPHIQEGMREITESEYNSFLTAPTNTHTSRISTQVMPPKFQQPQQNGYDPYLIQQQGQGQNKQIQHRRDHLSASLRHWNPLLDKYTPQNKKQISRSYEEDEQQEDSAPEATEASPTTSTSTLASQTTPTTVNKRREIRIRRTTTTSPSPPPTTTTTSSLTIIKAVDSIVKQQ